MATATIWLRLKKAFQRRSARRLARRPFRIPPGPPMVSFTFDDFPRSALTRGGAILEARGLTATYYASFGLMSRTAPTGAIFAPDDLKPLLDRGHELGCHTFDHCHAWDTPAPAFEASVARNADALRRLAPQAAMRTLSYPISVPRPSTKRRCARRFAGCRGGGQTHNVGIADLNNLAAFFLEQSRDRPDAIHQAIEASAAAGGWLILATHDVDERPTPFGCAPALFASVVDWAVASGAEILPVFEALQRIQRRSAPAGVSATVAS